MNNLRKMKKMTYIILAAVLIVLILVISVYGYFGGFSSIHFKVEKQGGETIVYESVTGDYKNASKYTNKIYFDLLNKDKVETTKGIGIYYDNPQVTDKDKSRLGTANFGQIVPLFRFFQKGGTIWILKPVFSQLFLAFPGRHKKTKSS